MYMSENNPSQVHCVKKICRAGTSSLSVNLTKELKVLGLDINDNVQIVISRVD